ncbi:low molecular weight phosphotyrosine protein phosphatase [Cordyceps fumosorosea ARSEF 2679]|uniref:protein-tyrosine-phosphatase n=1 Tax=Cordyceps fumosorosea (strain ARSEF 2679) TaxID=1081104 RepID=A0A167PLZ6_CORFA|nr:low molecular weight phosphotyrosine protein phosphatase [Cordyceps fumosorosea ARSEF 2679]OAA56802.1 low molecular weight phosphotyrosine protein phosphatase [Cordyceps fumosorosea ARSEF 2679]
MPEKTSVLFVCLGNICRSTMAEGIFRHLAQKPEWKDKIGRVDSCGTGEASSFPLHRFAAFRLWRRQWLFSLADDWVYPSTAAAYHTGESPDDRTMATLEENGITDYDHAARRFATSDFDKFDYIFAMDRSNLSDLERLQRGNPDAKARVVLFGEYSGTGKAEVVSDPYYGGDAGFKRAFEQCSRFARNFLNDVVGGDEKSAL